MKIGQEYQRYTPRPCLAKLINCRKNTWTKFITLIIFVEAFIHILTDIANQAFHQLGIALWVCVTIPVDKGEKSVGT